MKCEKCLYRKNCQFIAKDYKVPTYVCECTAFESEEEFKAKVKLEAIKEFAERFLKIVYDNHHPLISHGNSVGYGMFTIGIRRLMKR